jgi:hypothetical protein
MYLKLLEKQEKTNPKLADGEKKIKVGAEINEIETKKLFKESMKQKVVSSEKLTRLTNP